MTRRSWITAISAAMAIFHSKRNEMYATTTTKKTSTASTALSVIWLPHVGPTSVSDT